VDWAQVGACDPASNELLGAAPYKPRKPRKPKPGAAVLDPQPPGDGDDDDDDDAAGGTGAPGESMEEYFAKF
jgi:hypothetical protein